MKAKANNSLKKVQKSPVCHDSSVEEVIKYNPKGKVLCQIRRVEQNINPVRLKVCKNF